MSKHLVVRYISAFSNGPRYEDFDEKCVKYSTKTSPLIVFLDEQDNLLGAIHERFIERIDVRED